MTKLIDPTRLNQKRTRRETLGLFGAGGVMAVATAMPRSAFAAVDALTRSGGTLAANGCS